MTQEYERLKEVSKNISFNKECKKSFLKKFKQLFVELMHPKAYKPVIVLIILFSLQQLSGDTVVQFYSQTIFNEFSETSAVIGLILFAAVRLIMTFITAACSKRIGRRILLILSGSGMCVTMIFLTVFLYLASADGENVALKDSIKENRLIFPCFFLYECASCLGFSIIPWTLVDELLPTSVKGKFSGIMIALAFLEMFAVNKIFPHLQSLIGLRNVFLLFGIFSLAATIFVYKFVPETLGKSFAEIENYFKKK